MQNATSKLEVRLGQQRLSETSNLEVGLAKKIEIETEADWDRNLHRSSNMRTARNLPEGRREEILNSESAKLMEIALSEVVIQY